MKLKRKRPPLLAILAMAVLVTSLMASGTLARYSSSMGATGTINVAAFAVGTETATFEVAMEALAPGESSKVRFTVQNYEDEKLCEVALDYEIHVETTGNLPLLFTLEGQQESGDSIAYSRVTEKRTNVSETSFTATGGRLPVANATAAEGGGKKHHDYELSVDWPLTSSNRVWDYSQEIDMITVTITAVQVDPGTGE